MVLGVWLSLAAIVALVLLLIFILHHLSLPLLLFHFPIFPFSLWSPRGYEYVSSEINKRDYYYVTSGREPEYRLDRAG